MDIVSVIPFPGRLKLFYENEAVLKPIWRIMAVHTHSYAHYNESKDIMVGNYDGSPQIISYDTEELSRMISYGDRYVYVERQAFEDFLEENNAEGIAKATGWTIVYQHSYIDENGKYHCRMQTRNDGMLKLSDKLREGRKKNSDKLLEKTKEKAAEKKEELEEALEEKKVAETEEGTAENVQEESIYNKAEQLLEEKMAASKDGMIYLNETDMKTIIEAAQEEDAGKTTVKDQPQVGANLDLKI